MSKAELPGKRVGARGILRSVTAEEFAAESGWRMLAVLTPHPPRSMPLPTDADVTSTQEPSPLKGKPTD